MANAPGNGCADDKAVYPFVPDMIRYYLGEEPTLGSGRHLRVRAETPTGSTSSSNLEKLVVKAVDEAGGYGMLMGPQSTAAQRDEFRERSSAEPRKYIAQHRIELSTCPDLGSYRVNGSRHAACDLRPFILIATRRYVGAAGRSDARRPGRRLVRGQLQPRRRLQRHLGRAGGRSVISRVADHCFWFGRYLDRAESTARLLQATRTLVFDADIPVTQCWQPLVIVAGEEEPFVAKHGREALGNGELVQEYMTWNRDNMVSLASSVRAARECARAIRDQLSLEAWEEVNELYLWLSRESDPEAVLGTTARSSIAASAVVRS